MSPEEYAVHRERVTWLSEHPLVERNQRGRGNEQTDLSEWLSEEARHA